MQINGKEFHGRCVDAFATGGGDAVVTFKYLADVMDAILDGTKASARKRAAEIAALNAEIEKLKAALAQKAPIKYLGIHKPGATYSEGSLVTRDGSIFHANKTTSEMPGDGCVDWTLAVKRGRDGRDAKYD
jgi:hypothetical protein